MTPAQAKIVGEMQESLRDILETAKLVHGEKVSRFAFVMSGCASASQLAVIAAHAPCGTDVHEQALNDLDQQLLNLANTFAVVLELTPEQVDLAKGVTAALQRSVQSNNGRLLGAGE